MPISRSARVYVVPREPGGPSWTGDSGRVPRLSIFVSPHRPSLGPLSACTNCFITYASEPWRGRSRHEGCREGEGALTARCGPGRGSPAVGACPRAVVAGWNRR
jgi:hypothetical protein